MDKNIAAIHAIKSRLGLQDDDYRALLVNLTGKSSSKAMAPAEQARVREHMQQLAVRMGVAKPAHSRRTTFAQAKAVASPKERKVWALWNQLGRDGVVHNTSAAALNAWVERTVHVSARGFATSAHLDTLIEGLKAWQKRGYADA